MEYRHSSNRVPGVFRNYPNMAADFPSPGTGHDVVFKSDYDHPKRLSDCSNCEHDRLQVRLARCSQVPIGHYGFIASGNQVMCHGATRERLWRQTRAICFEMETAGLVDMVPCLVIRRICGCWGSHNHKRRPPEAVLTAACYARAHLFEPHVA